MSLRTLAPGVAFAPKKTARGAGQRIAALARWLDVGEALGDLPSGARLDDVLDALAAAWSAQRWAAGTAEVLGEERRRPRPADAGRRVTLRRGRGARYRRRSRLVQATGAARCSAAAFRSGSGAGATSAAAAASGSAGASVSSSSDVLSICSSR